MTRIALSFRFLQNLDNSDDHGAAQNGQTNITRIHKIAPFFALTNLIALDKIINEIFMTNIIKFTTEIKGFFIKNEKVNKL